MIYKISSNNDSFKEITFNKGLNIIVGARSEESNRKSTRNGVGKTTLIKIINFCLGSKKERLPIKHLEGWEFSIEMDLFGEKIIATRPIGNEIFIKGNTDNFPISPIDKGDYKYYKLNDWRTVLGKALFDFEKDKSVKYNPSFRKLIHYFVRNNKEAYNDPFKKVIGEKAVDTQVNNAFLLGLNWKDASEAQEIKDEADTISKLKKIYNEHFLKDLGKTISKSKGALETEQIKLESVIAEREEELIKFEINEQYKYYEKRANDGTKNINRLSDQRLILKQKLEQYNESVKDESDADSLDIEIIYNELGFYFKDSVKKTLEQANEFHKAIIKNRKEFLRVEIVSIENQILKIDELIKAKNLELANIMNILNSSIALEKYRLIDTENIKTKEMLEKVKSKIKDIDDIDNRENNLKTRRGEFGNIIKRNYEESKPDWSQAVKLFDKNTRALYNESGSLITEVSDKGFKFKIGIAKGESDGISNMKIFCYDLTLLQLFSQRNEIDFLIHDSNIFYGVDERQVASGLHYLYKESLEKDIQYICTINSDDIPYNEIKKDFRDFNIDNFIIRELKDSDPSETLLGFYFN